MKEPMLPGLGPEPRHAAPAADPGEQARRRHLNRCRQARCRWFLPIGPRCGHKAVHATEQKGKVVYGYAPDCKDVSQCPEGKATND